MSENEATRTPLRVRELRMRKGITQEALANQARVCISTIRELEQQPENAGISLAKLHAIACALGVTTSALFVPPHTDPVPVIHDVHPLRMLLEPAPPAGDPPTLDSLRTDLRIAKVRLDDDDYDFAIPALGELAARCQATVAAAERPAAKRAARKLVVQVYRQMAIVLTATGHPDLALKAADAIEGAARDEGEPVWLAESMAARSWPMTRQGRFTELINSAETIAHDVEPDVRSRDVERVGVWGFLMCWVSGAAARDNQPELAEDAMRRADIASAILGSDQCVNGVYIGPTNVARRRVESAVVNEDYKKAAKLAQRMPRGGKLLPRSRHRHVLDLANISLELRNSEKALGLLTGLRETAPTWLECQPYAATITTKLIDRSKRRITPELRDLATFLRIP